MRTRLLAAAALLIALPVAGFVAFQSSAETDAMGGMMMMTAPEGASDATKAYVETMNKMSMSMGAEFTGDADVDFITGMIPHHQGAVDAARIVLQYGADPDVKAFAEKIIAAQESEIAWMNAWLAAHPK